jgi:hypothetical protein
MTSIRKTVVALFLAVGALSLMPVLAAAATQYQDSVSGAEVFATNSEGVFVGTASGDLPGAWSADVKHTDLTSGSATITSGSFDLVTVFNSRITVVAGSFNDGGTIALHYAAPGCGIQQYYVTDTLSKVGVGPTPSGTGSFSVVLTHFRAKIFGTCITYAATVAGTVGLTF